MKFSGSLVTKVLVKTFHAFCQGRLKAEMSDPEVVLTRDANDTSTNGQPSSPPRRRKVAETHAAPIKWAEFSSADLPTVGLL